MVDPRGVAKSDKRDYEYLRTEELPIVIESDGPGDDVHQRVLRALKQLGIADNSLLSAFIQRDLGNSSPLPNVVKSEPHANVEAGVKDGELHLRIIHDWLFDIKTGDLIKFLPFDGKQR
jgi:hypothetical protein